MHPTAVGVDYLIGETNRVSSLPMGEEAPALMPSRAAQFCILFAIGINKGWLCETIV